MPWFNNGIDVMKANYQRIAELEAQLAAATAKLARLEWKLITPESLPNVGDEVWSPTQNQHLISYSLNLRNGVYCVMEEADEEARAKLARLGFTHYRPLNPPPTPDNPAHQEGQTAKPSPE